MKTNTQKKTISLGDLIAAAYDEAEAFTNDTAEVTRLAAMAVSNIVLRSRNEKPAPSSPAATLTVLSNFIQHHQKRALKRAA